MSWLTPGTRRRNDESEPFRCPQPITCQFPRCDCDRPEPRMTNGNEKQLSAYLKLEAQLKAILRDHWITDVVCDHEAGTDRPVCACSLWRCDPRPTVGAAVEAWIEHVFEQTKDERYTV